MVWRWATIIAMPIRYFDILSRCNHTKSERSIGSKLGHWKIKKLKWATPKLSLPITSEFIFDPQRTSESLSESLFQSFSLGAGTQNMAGLVGTQPHAPIAAPELCSNSSHSSRTFQASTSENGQKEASTIQSQHHTPLFKDPRPHTSAYTPQAQSQSIGQNSRYTNHLSAVNPTPYPPYAQPDGGSVLRNGSKYSSCPSNDVLITNFK